MISIEVNGQRQEIANGLTVSGLLQLLGLTEKRVAVELNREIITRSLHAQTALKDQDRVELVTAIGGG